MLAVVAWTLWAMLRCLAWCWACLCCRSAGQVEENGQMLPVDHAQSKPREPPSKRSQAKVAKDIFFFCVDTLSDLNGIGTFIYTGNFQFACVSFLVFALSFGQQLATGGFRTFRQEAANSLSEGCLTDELRRLTLTEKSVEAPLQLLIQLFSFLYVTFSDYAVLSFSVSMLVSLSSVVDAAYMLIELNLLPELQEVSTSYLSVQTNSKEVQLGDGKDVAKWSLRAMSGVEKNTRRQIAQRPKKLFQRYWLNGQWIHAYILAVAALKMYWIQRRSLFLSVFCWLLCHSGGLVICCFLCRGAPHSFQWRALETADKCCTFFRLTWCGQQIFTVYML